MELATLPEEYRLVEIPRLILQPICENVFKHVVDQMEETLILKISYVSIDEEHLEIHIEDSGTTLSEETLVRMDRQLTTQGEQEEISGLTNVHLRLSLLYGSEYGLAFERGNMGGLLVKVCLNPQKGG